LQTHFTEEQLKDSDTAHSNGILRKCVHCGFCTATCPTYQVLGDELDSPRGRIYLMKDMLEAGRPADEKTVKHIDRCLSCLSCMSTCPSGVNYMHLVDHARAHIEKTYKRPMIDRFLRSMLAFLLPKPKVFRLALLGARVAKPFRKILPMKLRGMVDMAPADIPPVSWMDDVQIFPAKGNVRMRVAMLSGCAQKALNPDINAATIRLLTRHGCDVIIAKGMGCCGALTHHMGKTDQAHASAAANIRAWMLHKPDAVVINASGCGTTVKDYGHMFRDDETLAVSAKHISDITKDISEIMQELELLDPVHAKSLNVTYHSACSLQHGQQIKTAPKTLLKTAGFKVSEPKNPHLCCGSAGTYNLLQPEIAGELKTRKLDTIKATNPDVIAAGNIGCMTQLAGDIPIVHTVELLDWATGGPKPASLE